MAWDVAAGSSIFRAWMEFALTSDPTWNGGWGTVAGPNPDGRFKVAIYDDTPDPDKSVLAAAACYNAGEWLTANEVPDTGGTDDNWPPGGVDLVGVTIVRGQGYANPALPSGPAELFPLTLLATNTTNDSNGAGTVTLDNVVGDLLYQADPPTVPVGMGAAFHWFGGPNQVTAGTFTIIWHTLGTMVQVV
jgi:hypothetical protein